MQRMGTLFAYRQLAVFYCVTEVSKHFSWDPSTVSINARSVCLSGPHITLKPLIRLFSNLEGVVLMVRVCARTTFMFLGQKKTNTILIKQLPIAFATISASL